MASARHPAGLSPSDLSTVTLRPAASLRLDKFLWFSRLQSSRGDAVKLCESRHLRLDGRVIDKAHAPVRIGSVIGFPRHGRVMIVRVKALPERRGPAREAAATYEDLSAPKKPAITPADPSHDVTLGM